MAAGSFLRARQQVTAGGEGPPIGPSNGRSYTSRTSLDARDPAWERFLREAPGGHYMQSGEWADFKLAFDWSVARVAVQHGNDLVGGAQVLLRRLPGLGAVGWAPKAPVVAEPEPELMQRVLDELGALVKRLRVRVLMLQPPPDPSALLDALPRWGYRPSPVLMGPRATILLDLRQDLEAIEAGMRPKTRQHVHKGLREGVTVRQGKEEDLETFYRLHLATCERQQLSPYPKRHFVELWRAFGHGDGARLFFAEYDGEALSGLLVLVYGDTVHTHAMAWSGRHAKRMANDVLLWSVIAWGRAHGYRLWDFTWIDSRAGAAISKGGRLPEDLRNSVSFFKLGFGGTVTMLPGPYDYVPNRALRAAVHSLVPLAYRLKSVQKAHHQLRWRWLPSSRTSASDRSPADPLLTR